MLIMFGTCTLFSSKVTLESRNCGILCTNQEVQHSLPHQKSVHRILQLKIESGMCTFSKCHGPESYKFFYSPASHPLFGMEFTRALIFLRPRNVAHRCVNQ